LPAQAFRRLPRAGRGCLYWVCEADFVPESRLCKAQTAARLNTLRGLATQQSLFYGAKAATIPNINSPVAPEPHRSLTLSNSPKGSLKKQNRLVLNQTIFYWID